MKESNQDYFKDNLKNTSWLGEVVINEDPEFEGRIKVKVFGKFDDIPDEHIPWAFPANNNSGGSASGGGQYSVPKVGSIVSVTFDNGNIYHPQYHYQQKISDELKAEVKEDPINFHSLLFDTDENVKIFYAQQQGLRIEFIDTVINLDTDNNLKVTNPNGDVFELLNDGNTNLKVSADVYIECANSLIECSGNITANAGGVAEIEAPQIKLGAAAGEAIIKGTTFKTIFENHNHIGNLGAPTSPAIATGFMVPLSTKSFTE